MGKLQKMYLAAREDVQSFAEKFYQPVSWLIKFGL